MRAIQHSHGFGKQELQAMAEGQEGPGTSTIDDMEFLETLAQRRCLVMPPWVFHIEPSGKLSKVTPIKYRPDYNLDKPAILLAVMKKLGRVH